MAFGDKPLGLLREIEGGDGVLAHGFLIFGVKLGILVLDDLAHANLRQFLRHQLSSNRPRSMLGLSCTKADDFVQVLLTDARCLLAIRLGKALDLDLVRPCLLIDTDVATVSDVATLAVVKTRRRAAVRVLRLELETRARTCSISRLAAMAFKVSLTASVTASSEASGSAIRLVNLARALQGASRVARPMICTISVRLAR